MSEESSRRALKVTARWTVFTHGRLLSAAHHFLQEAKASEEGQYYNCMGTVVFSAFALEAYLNAAGEKLLNCWEGLERTVGPKQKLRLLTEMIDFDLDLDKRPFQSFQDVFWFRNRMAHGRPTHVEREGIQKLEPGERPSLPEIRWEGFCTLPKAEQCYEDAMAMIQTLHAAAGLPKELLMFSGEGEWEIRQAEATGGENGA